MKNFFKSRTSFVVQSRKSIDLLWLNLCVQNFAESLRIELFILCF